MEYAKYIPTPNLNIAGLTAKLATSIYGIETAKQTKRAEMDQLKADTDEALNSVEMSDSQDFNDLTLKMVDNGRTGINTLYKKLKAGEISPAEYRMAINKFNKNLGTFANTAKSFDEQFIQYKKRQEPGANGFPQAAHFEYKLAEMFGKVAELDRKDARFNDKGDLFVIDKITGEAQSIDVLNRPENIIQDRFDLVGSTASIVKGFEASTTWKDLGRGGEKAVEGFLQNDASKEAIATGVNSMVANPRDAASILTDWGGVDADYYMNEQEYSQMYNDRVQKKIQAKKDAGLPVELSAAEKKEIEMSLIKIEKQGAIINPVLSPEQMKKSKEIADNFIRSNIYEKVTGSPKQDWYHAPSGGGSGDGDGTKKETSNLYEDLLAAWNISRGGTRDSALESESRFNALAEGKYEFKWAPGGIQVSKVVIDEQTGRKSLIPIRGTVANLDALQKYFYPDKNLYDIEKSETLGKKKKVSETVGKKSQAVDTYSRKDLKANGWSDSQINQAVKEGKIKVK